MKCALRRGLLLLGLGLWLPACGPWDLGALEARHPRLREVGSATLAELNPYFIAAGDELTAFVCRWPDGVRLGVRVEGEAGPEDRQLLARALAAWEGAGLGVRFALNGSPTAIEVRFEDAAGERSGAAAVDCRARLASAEQLDASLVSARISLRREASNWKGQRVPLDPAERLGAALHELGHALGFQGHPQRGSVMVRSVDHVRWAGRALLAGRPFRDAALAALYALPNGTVLGRLALPAGRTRALDAARPGAAEGARATWWVRVGDRSARLHRGPGSALYLVPDIVEILRNPERFEAIPLGRF